MSCPPKSNTGNPNGVSHILIEIGYSCKFILPIENIGTFIDTYTKSREIKSGYNEPTKVLDTPPKFTIAFVTPQEIAKWKFDETLGLNSDDDT